MFYGWVIVGVTFVVQFVVMGTVLYSFGFFLKPIAAEVNGGSRFGVSFALPALSVLGAALAPAVGRWVDRGPIRLILLLGALATSLGFAALSQIGSLWHFYFVYGIPFALGVALLGGIANPALIANWFVRRRGTALGISQFGVSFSGVVAGLAVPGLIGALGWRGALLVYAVLPLAVLAPLVWLVVVDRPEDRGLAPDGLPGSAPLPAADGEPWTLRRATRERSIWLVASIIGLCFAANGTMVQIIQPHATDLGLSPEQAGLVVSCMALLGAFGKPFYGWMGDRFDLRYALWLCIAGQSLGTLLLIRATSSAGFVVAGMVFGLGYGGVLPLHALLVGALYGRAVFGSVMGVMMPLLLPFQLLGLPLSGWLFDRTGSYSAAFGVFVGFFAAAAALVFALRLPGAPRDLSGGPQQDTTMSRSTRSAST